MNIRQIEASVSIERRYDLVTHESTSSFIYLHVKYSHMFPLIFEWYMPDGLDELLYSLQNLPVGSWFDLNYDRVRRTNEEVLDLLSVGPYLDREDNIERYYFSDVIQLVKDVQRCVETLIISNPDCNYSALTRLRF